MIISLNHRLLNKTFNYFSKPPNEGSLFVTETGASGIYLPSTNASIFNFVFFCSKMYWTDEGFGTIERASMEDGSDRQILVDSGLSEPFGLGIDVSSKFGISVHGR